MDTVQSNPSVSGGGSLDDDDEEHISDCKILLVGDPGVGKTTIIASLFYDSFVEEVPAAYERVLIPPDISPDCVSTEIIDYSTRKHSKDELFALVQNSQVICIIYSITDSESIERVSSHWLPLVQNLLGGPDHGKSVIVAANKSDNEKEICHVDKMVSLMNDYSEIETVVECSAKIMKNISEIFFYAQKAVLYPFRPLFSIDDRELLPKCRKALVRIFKISDCDNDGLLSDEELKNFQMLAFGIPLTSSALDEVKQVLSDQDSQNILSNSLTLNGFLYLHKMFIQRGRHETVWTVLKQFGYNLSLQLRQEYLLPKIKIPKGCSVEPSPLCIHFITKLFKKYDEDADNCLSSVELQNLFSLCSSMPLCSSKDALYSVETNEKNWLTFNGFINLWTMNFTVNLVQALEQLAYLGFNVEYGSQKEAIIITRDRRIDIAEKSTERKIFQCHVIGPKDAGKTVFCKSFVGKTIKDIEQINRKNLSPYTINSVSVKDAQTHLLLHEVDVYSPNDLLSTYEKVEMTKSEWGWVINDFYPFRRPTLSRYFYRTKVPCLIIATKVEEYEVEQEYEHQPSDFCLIHQLPKPVRFRNADIGKSKAAVFSKLATMATYPHLTKKIYFLEDFSNIFQKAIGITAIGALIGFLIYKNL